MLSLEQALAALPDTADGIAAHLGAKGVRGVPENAECCPIANYLTGWGFVGPYVDGNFIEVDDEEDQHPTPPQMNEFIRRFDAGEWPELVAELPDDEPEAADV